MNILIIGAGQIGSRHIESLYKSHNKYNIHVIEPQNVQIIKLKKILSTYKKKNNIFFYKKILKFDFDLDFVIISTNANVRRKIFTNLIKSNTFKNILFEKIVFSSLKDYRNTQKEINRRKINAFVNFPRRSFKVYKYIKKKLIKTKNINYSLIGKNWGFATNTLHNIDLFSYLTNNSELKVNTFNIDKIRKSKKRKGFIEFNGLIIITNNRDDILILQDFKSSKDTNLLNGGIKIENSQFSFLIYENLSKMYEINNKNFFIKEIEIKLPKQSELTDKFIQKFKRKNISDLPTLDECYHIHFLYINSLSKQLVKINNKYKNKIPIT